MLTATSSGLEKGAHGEENGQRGVLQGVAKGFWQIAAERDALQVDALPCKAVKLDVDQAAQFLRGAGELAVLNRRLAQVGNPPG